MAPTPEVPVINRKTILVVDDHEDSRMIYSTILQHYGYIAITARDGEEALRFIHKYGPDAVVTDLHIPRLDGCELIKALRQDPATAHIRTILITADALPEARQQAEEAGCDVFLLKPSEPHHLVHKVRELIGTARSQITVA